MPRATNAPASRKRRKRTLAKAKGFRGFRSTHFRYAKDAVRKAMLYAYRDRKVRKRTFRNLWVQRINAAAPTANSGSVGPVVARPTFVPSARSSP